MGERLSYPDITILQNLCAILQVTEHELLTGSEDTSRRVSERLAQKYRKLTRNYRIIQYVIFGLSLFIMPVLLYQLPLSQWMGERKISMYLLIETGLLLFLLLVCDLNDQGSWFFTAALGVLLGLGLKFLPIILRQTLRDLSLYRHKALLYLSAETVFLMLLLFVAALQDGNLRGFWILSFPNALLFLALPWGVMAGLRYLPVNRWLRALAAFAWMGLWLWLAPAGFDQIMIPVYGEPDKPYSLIIPFDFTKWELPYNAWNVIMIILLVLGAAALVCGCMGLRAMKNRKTHRSYTSS